MNLFLGVFVPHKNKPALWDREAPQESYLHSPELCDPTLYSESNFKKKLYFWESPFLPQKSKINIFFETFLRIESERGLPS